MQVPSLQTNGSLHSRVASQIGTTRGSGDTYSRQATVPGSAILVVVADRKGIWNTEALSAYQGVLALVVTFASRQNLGKTKSELTCQSVVATITIDDASINNVRDTDISHAAVALSTVKAFGTGQGRDAIAICSASVGNLGNANAANAAGALGTVQIGIADRKEIGEAESQSAHKRRGTVLIRLAGGDDLRNTESRDTSCYSFAVVVRLAAGARVHTRQVGHAQVRNTTDVAARARFLNTTAREASVRHAKTRDAALEASWANFAARTAIRTSKIDARDADPCETASKCGLALGVGGACAKQIWHAYPEGVAHLTGTAFCIGIAVENLRDAEIQRLSAADLTRGAVPVRTTRESKIRNAQSTEATEET
ncbi:unnamed protein product [Clonostachys chloroleuca]|uniref:Uncharacterized protein n=1 Tax=Clonostachys chloroleuca TaxID=1926264 RepID=A0AA35VF40_9HYPO|nr:unnamed protein product [Clonostachys chloroleuca]